MGSVELTRVVANFKQGLACIVNLTGSTASAFNTVTLNTVTVDTGHLIPTSLSTATINPGDT